MKIIVSAALGILLGGCFYVTHQPSGDMGNAMGKAVAEHVKRNQR